MRHFTNRLFPILLGLVAALVLSRSGSTAQQPSPTQAGSVRLDRCGDPLPAGAIARLGSVRFRTGYGLNGLAVSPDGKTIATTDRQLWDSATGKPIYSWKSDFGLARVMFDPQNKTLVCDTGGNVVEIRDRATGKPLRVVKTEFRRDHGVLCGDGSKFVMIDSPKTDKGPPPDGTLVVINVATGVESLRLKGQDFSATAVGISYDGNTFAVAGDRNLRFYGSEKGKLLRALKGRPVQAVDLRFDPTGRILLVHEQDRSLSLWDISTGAEIRRIPFGCEAFAFSQDGKRLAAAGQRGTAEDARVHVWDTATGKELFPPVRSPDGALSDLAFFPDGNTLGGTTYGGWIRLWDMATGKEKTQPGHQATIPSLSFGKDGLTLASGGADGTVRLWDPRTGEELRTWDAPRQFSIIAFSPDRTLLACGGHGPPESDKPAPIVLWDPLTGKETLRLPGHPAGVFSLAFAPDGKMLATGGGDKLIRLWDLTGPRPFHQLRGHGQTPNNLTFAPGGRMLASSAPDGSVRLWEAITGAARGQFSFIGGKNPYDGMGSTIFFDGDVDGFSVGANQHRFGPLFFSEDGKQLFLAGDDDSLDVVFSPKAVEHKIDENPNERRIFRYYGGYAQHVPSRYSLRVCDLGTGKVTRRIPERILPSAMEYLIRSTDRKRLAWVSGSVITAWDIERNQEAGSCQSPQSSITALALSPDDRLLASAGSDGTVLIWDLSVVLAKKPVVPPSALARATQLQSSWTQLADADAGKAYQAMLQLARTPADTVAFLKPRLNAIPPIEPAKLAQWVADLDDADFDVRAKATSELAQRDDALPEMLKALRNKPSLESRRRIEQLLDYLDKQPSADFLRAYRAVEVLEQIRTPDALEILDRLAQGAPQARLTLAAAAARQRMKAK